MAARSNPPGAKSLMGPQAPRVLGPASQELEWLLRDQGSNETSTLPSRFASRSRKNRSNGQPDYEIVACIHGRGFGVRREDMRILITRTEGKVFTLATLDQMVAHTRLQQFLPLEKDS